MPTISAASTPSRSVMTSESNMLNPCGGSPVVRPRVVHFLLLGGVNGNRRTACFFGLGRAFRAEAAQFQPRHAEHKPVAPFDLVLQLFKQLILDFEHRMTPLTGEVHVVLVGAGLVVMPVPVHVHQVKLINDAEFLERFQSAIDRGQVQAGHLLLSPAQDFRRVEVLAGLLKHIRDHATLAGHTETMFAELGGDGAALLEVLGKNHIQLRTGRNRDYPKIYTFMSRIISQEPPQCSARSCIAHTIRPVRTYAAASCSSAGALMAAANSTKFVASSAFSTVSLRRKIRPASRSS